MSGAPTDFLNVHTMGDTYKKVQERVDSLNSVLLNFLNYDVRYAKKILSKGSIYFFKREGRLCRRRRIFCGLSA
ncbi:hypothetical protein RhiirA5_367000 [Rhizophagus irregularis]|uniref:Uncharacterized protein n=1 Tax=Rhizophagus irregularis TaxID=588596 RepID=A0A2N0NV25_9GLOM|nr:hypothetical protein RhiirA5_367000 [Rhizophagus irregularis]GET59042.1 hypothetical protein GLOIN_2v1598434 [Rhizophagus irregularis DAOM 181602=DAOM 197198]